MAHLAEGGLLPAGPSLVLGSMQFPVLSCLGWGRALCEALSLFNFLNTLLTHLMTVPLLSSPYTVQFEVPSVSCWGLTAKELSCTTE